MKRKVKVAALTAAALACISLAAPASGQQVQSCVSRHSYGLVHRGMTRHQVARILHTRGREFQWSRGGNLLWQTRRYPTCTATYHSRVDIGFEGWAGHPLRMHTKSAHW